MEQVKNKKILDVENLKVYFYTKKGVSKAVDGNNFKMYENETLAIVGESGCGKSVTAMSILGLVDEPDRKSTRLNSSHQALSRMPSSA